MNILYILAFIVFAIILFFGIITPGWSQKKNQTNKTTTMDSIKRFLSKDEIAAKLITLAKSPPPAQLSLGAKCYEIALPPNREEYICPKCGERTLYTKDESFLVFRELPVCRTKVKSINCLDINLDESQFCHKCSPKKEHPELGIILKYKEDQKEQVIWGITKSDLDLLTEFCDGKDKHTGDYGNESPLKNYLGRIQELLKIKVNVK